MRPKCTRTEDGGGGEGGTDVGTFVVEAGKMEESGDKAKPVRLQCGSLGSRHVPGR